MKLWPRQLFICMLILGLLYGYYLVEYGLKIASLLAYFGLGQLPVHLIILPIFTTAFHLVLAGNKASGQVWFIIVTWIIAMLLVFNKIGQSFMAIISLMSALISFVLIKSALTYYWADELTRAKMKEGIKKHLPFVIRRIND
ncbi:hypothetical protein NBRC116592_34920 [Colwellia sp. KU-HH00111]